MFVVQKTNTYQNAKNSLFLRHTVQSRANSIFDKYFIFAKAASFLTGLFLLHKSSVGQSHTGTAVTSRGTDIKVYCVSVKFGAMDETLSRRSLSRYSQRPHARNVELRQRGCLFFFL
jgi:hypothetical protein